MKSAALELEKNNFDLVEVEGQIQGQDGPADKHIIPC
jgi:hypothetical protein